MRFTGRENQSQTFYAPVPTPSWRAADDTYLRGNHARLKRVGLKFRAMHGVNIIGMKVFVDAQQLDFPFFHPMRLGGDHSNTYVQNVNFFEAPNAPSLNGGGVCIEFEVFFTSPGEITFNSVGCDFIVP